MSITRPPYEPPTVVVIGSLEELTEVISKGSQTTPDGFRSIGRATIS